MKILLVDDETAILELLSYNLTKEGFTTISAETGRAALELARNGQPDLIVLDLMLPDMSGLDICRILRHDADTDHIPIIMATAKSEEEDVLKGLALGADDYISKPFSPKILVARIHSVLRRCRGVPESCPPKTDGHADAIICANHLTICPEKFLVKSGDTQISLSATEFAILVHLALHPGHVFTRQQIINAIKGNAYPVTERSIDVQILSIRKKLAEARVSPSIIETVRGIGYRMAEETEKSDA